MCPRPYPHDCSNAVRRAPQSRQTTPGLIPAGELMLAIAAWIAKQERLRISERTKAGVARAKWQGKHCGRPKRIFRRDEALQMHKAGMSLRAIAAKLDVSFMTVKRAVESVTKVPPQAA